jgi:hypothetical protein
MPAHFWPPFVAAKPTGIGADVVPVDIRVIHPHTIVLVTPSGEYDLEASKHTMTDVVAYGDGQTDYDVILDAQHVKSLLSIADLWHLAAHYATLPSASHRRIAIVVPPKRLERANFLALCGENNGFDTRGFAEVSDALMWLVGPGDKDSANGPTR